MPPTLEALRRRLQQALDNSRDPDPHKVAQRLALSLSSKESLEIAQWGLEQLAREETRRERHISTPGPSRRSIALKECVAGVWKFQTDCTYDDLLTLAQEYRDRSEALLAKAVEYEQLAAVLATSGCQTVGEMRSRIAA